MLAQTEMSVVFVSKEKITQSSLANGSERTLNGSSKYKSAKETSTKGNFSNGTG